mmetsp:Transcript_4926/g.7421  ORF Transcript_4926/g.7421 Transcript_4926/m.7421 type:complete len:101 (-) Transcript_4926:779-1081(-)
MKKPIVRKSDRVKFSPNEIQKDIEELFGPGYFKSKKLGRCKGRGRKPKTQEKDLEAVLGLASFIREVEGPQESPKEVICRAATHVNIAKYIHLNSSLHII